MLLWILLGVAFVVAIGTAWHASRDSWNSKPTVVGVFFGAWSVASIVAFLVCMVLILPFWHTMSYTQEDSTSTLKNIGDNHSIHGEYSAGLFVAYGVVDGTRTINFVSEHDGYAVLGQVDAD